MFIIGFNIYSIKLMYLKIFIGKLESVIWLKNFFFCLIVVYSFFINMCFVFFYFYRFVNWNLVLKLVFKVYIRGNLYYLLLCLFFDV